MSLWRPEQDQLTQDEVSAIRASGLISTDQVAKKSELEGKVSVADFQSFLDVMDWQNSVNSPVQYYKETAPTGAGASEGELCVCADGKLYEFTGGAWVGTSFSVGDRFWHYETGTDDSGDSGTHTASNKLYEWDGESLLDDSPTFGTIASVESEGEFYWYDGVIVKKFSSSQLTANEVAAIQAANFAPGDVVAKLSDIPSPQLTENELAAIQAANFAPGDVVAKLSDIPSPQLTENELAAIQAANLTEGDTVAKLSDIVEFESETTFRNGIVVGSVEEGKETRASILNLNSDLADLVGNSWAATGTAQISTSVKKIGAGSLYIPNVSENYISSSSPNFQIGNNSFTIHFWWRKSGSSYNILRLGNSSSDLYIYTGPGSPIMVKLAGGTILNSGDGDPNDNQWYHIALVGKDGNTMWLFKDGVLRATRSAAYNFSYTDIYLGGVNGDYGIYGYIDSFVFDNRKALWEANFTPPTTEETTPFTEGSISLRSPNSTDVLTLTYTKLAAIFAHVGI